MIKAIKFLTILGACAATAAFAHPMRPDPGIGRGGEMPRTNTVSTNILRGPLGHYDADGDGTVTTNEFAAASAAFAQEHLTNFLSKYDANSDASVSTAEVKAVAEAFAERWLTNLLARYDRDADGNLTTNEVRRYRGGHSGPSITELDLNGDGVISNGELVLGGVALAEDQEAALLDRFDTNSDGTITSAEVVSLFQADADERIADLLEKFDANDDGNVTAEEIAAARPAAPARRAQEGARRQHH